MYVNSDQLLKCVKARVESVNFPPVPLRSVNRVLIAGAFALAGDGFVYVHSERVEPPGPRSAMTRLFYLDGKREKVNYASPATWKRATACV